MEERSLQDRISSLVLEAFRKLPNKCKPQENEWTCLAAVVASTCSDKNLEILTLATGNKCLGICKMCRNGTVINDSHAEVLARRALKLLLWNELMHDLKDSQTKDFSSDNATKRNLFWFYKEGKLPSLSSDEESFLFCLQKDLFCLRSEAFSSNTFFRLKN